MSLAEGINLGLQLSRGSRDEVRRDKQLAQQEEQIRRQNEFQDKMQPLQYEAAQLDLSNSKQYQAHLSEMRPLDKKRAELTNAELEAEQKRQSELHPLQVQSEKARFDVYTQQHEQDKIAFQDQQKKAELAAKKEWVAEQAGIEWSRYEKTGQFSDKFLGIASEIDSPLSPHKFLDTKYVNALDTVHNMLDPKHPESYADKGKLMPALDVLFSERLNMQGTAPNGSPIKKREITDIYPVMKNGKPVSGKFYINLKVTPEQGEAYEAPLTVNGSSDGKDPIKEVDLGDVIKVVRSQSFFANAVKNNPESQARLAAQLKELRRGKIDEVDWKGSRRKLSELREIYKEDTTLQGPDGAKLVSFADYEWTAGDPGRLDFAITSGMKNQALLTEINKARADNDQAKVAELSAKWINVQDAWDFAERTAAANKSSAEAANQKIQTKDIPPEQLAKHQASNPAWYLDELTPAQARTLTKEQWAARTAKSNEGAKQQEQASQADQNKQKGLALVEGQKRLAAFQANNYIDSQFASLPLASKQSWFEQNAHLLNDDQKFKATNMINAEIFGKK